MVSKIIFGDCIEELKKLSDNSIDLILTDPPYNLLQLGWDNEIDWDLLGYEMWRVLKENGSLYIFCQFPVGFRIFNGIAQYLIFKQDLVWVKNRGFSLARSVYTRYHENILFFTKDNKRTLIEFGKYIKQKRLEIGLSLREVGKLCGEEWYHRGGSFYFETAIAFPSKRKYQKLKEVLKLDNRFDNLFDNHLFNFEDVKLEGEPYTITRKKQKLYGVKSNMGEYTQVNDGKRNPKTILEYSIIQGGKEYVGHPTQKPVELLKYLIIASTNKGDIVLDCFAGSGSTLVACEQTERIGIGIDNNKEYVEICNKRLQQKSLFVKDKQKGTDGGNDVRD